MMRKCCTLPHCCFQSISLYSHAFESGIYKKQDMVNIFFFHFCFKLIQHAFKPPHIIYFHTEGVHLLVTMIGLRLSCLLKIPKIAKIPALIGENLKNNILLNSWPIFLKFNTCIRDGVYYHLTKFHLDRLPYADRKNLENLHGKPH